MTDSTNGINGVGSTPAATTGSATSSVGSLDKDAFLKLLVAQLKYQDPMKPSDPSQFMAQTAQFTMVERLDAMTKAQTEATSWQRVVAGQGMIGRQVSGIDEQGNDVSGVVQAVKMTAYGPVLELPGGRTLSVDAVLDVTTAPSTTAPSTTAPSTTAPSTTAPSTTAPSTTPPSTTAPSTGDAATGSSGSGASGTAA